VQLFGGSAKTMSLSFPRNYRRIGSPETAAAGQFGAEAVPSTAASAQRLRTLLIVGLVATMPLTTVFGDKGTGTASNMAASDVLMPLGVLFLGSLLMKKRLLLPMITLCLLSVSSIVASIFCNLDIYFRDGQTLRIAIEVAKVVCLWLIFYLFINLIQNRSDLRLLIKVWVLGGVVEALCGIGGSLAYQMGRIENPFSLMFRAEGTLGDSNLFAAHLGAAFFLTILYRKLSQRAPSWTFVAMALQLVGIYFSASRGGLLSVVASLIFLWLFATSGKQKLVLGAALGLGAVIVALAISNQSGLLASNPMTERLKTSTLSLNDPEAEQRARLWRVAVEGFLDSPIVGIGRGNYAYLEAGDPNGAGHAHNTLLGLLCETGLLGLTSYLAFGSAVLFGLVRDWLRNPDRERRKTDSILLTALLVVGLSGVTINIENYRGLWILLALVVAYQRLYVTGPSRKVAAAQSVAVRATSF
jgi:O-antigen ligase